MDRLLLRENKILDTGKFEDAKSVACGVCHHSVFWHCSVSQSVPFRWLSTPVHGNYIPDNAACGMHASSNERLQTLLPFLSHKRNGILCQIPSVPMTGVIYIRTHTFVWYAAYVFRMCLLHEIYVAIYFNLIVFI